MTGRLHPDSIGDITIQIQTAITLNSAGNCYSNIEDFQKAAELYEKSYFIKNKLFKDISGQLDMAKTLSALANCYDHLGEREKEIEFKNQLFELYEKAAKNEGKNASGEVKEHLKGLATELVELYKKIDDAKVKAKKVDFYEKKLASYAKEKEKEKESVAKEAEKEQKTKEKEKGGVRETGKKKKSKEKKK